MNAKKYFIEKYRQSVDFIARKRLKNSNFTIITNTCWGGVVYHMLGQQFLSPTINLWMHDKDFYRFVGNLHYYLGQKLKFVRTEEQTPVALLDDIEIHFNHYHSDEEAASKWYARCKRVNYDNLFIICSDRPNGEDVTYEEIRSLKDIPCRGKVVFSNRKYDDVDYLVPLPKDGENDWVNAYMFDKNKLGRWRWETAWDWVHWLNTGVIKRK